MTLYAAVKEPAHNLVQMEALLGNQEEVFRYLQEAYAKRDSQIPRLRSTPQCPACAATPASPKFWRKSASPLAVGQEVVL